VIQSRGVRHSMAQENPSWGEGRIAHELSLKLRLFVDTRTVGKYLKQGGWPRQPSGQRWATFIHNQRVFPDHRHS
jgi:hypothetical protein